jgi:hypothetical protein
VSNKVISKPTHTAWLVVGEKEKCPVIYTAFPGRLTATIKKYPGYSLDDLFRLSKSRQIPFAVKSFSA